jgi:hypothetical protein
VPRALGGVTDMLKTRACWSPGMPDSQDRPDS